MTVSETRGRFLRPVDSIRAGARADTRFVDNAGPYADARSAWHPVATVAELRACEGGRGPVGARLLGENLVVVVLEDGVRVLRDRCLHRAVRMSTGSVAPAPDGSLALQCPYHGWQWDGDGRCVGIPSVPDARPGWGLPARRIPTYESAVRYDLVWVRPERGGPAALPDFPAFDDPGVEVVAGEPYTSSVPPGQAPGGPGGGAVRTFSSPVDVGIWRTFWFTCRSAPPGSGLVAAESARWTR